MKKIFAAIITAVLLPLTFSAPAEAYRPAHSGPAAKHVNKDLCKNVKGKQTFYHFVHGYWQPNRKTRRPNDCVRGWRYR